MAVKIITSCEAETIAVNALYPAISDEDIDAICRKLAAAFGLPPFTLSHRSEYLETAVVTSGAMTITVTRFSGTVDAEHARRIGPPDHWNLAWRAAIGLEFNYQVAIALGAVTRNQQRTIARRLRSVFGKVQMHGDPASA
jgi:hypothetical protein